jgi:aspartyl aminopeptidase
LDSNNTIKETLIDVKKKIATIPSLAIHLDENANNERTINKQSDILPILSTNDDFEFEEFIKWQLEQNGIKDAKEIYASELSFYDSQNASHVGLRDDFIASARLDNLLSCYVGLLSICSIDEDKAMMFIANDHEEVGSESVAGASGSFLENTLKRMFSDYEEFVHMVRSSTLISADNAHAVHPNYPSKHDKEHSPLMNKGVVIKINANQRYASSSKTISKFMNVASNVGEPYQQFVTRSDIGCGSTIGPLTATRLGIDTIDVGLPTLAMHSIRELAGSDDAHSLYKIILGYTL